MKLKRFFITGTDTNCGKTYAICQLVDYFQEKQKNCWAIKPVASGDCNAAGISADVELIQQHNQPLPLPINRWTFKEPLSPHLAARHAGVKLTLDEISQFCLSDCYHELDYLFIEGAGGLLAPLNDEETWLDFLQLTTIPVILVVGMRLGCLNHALLTNMTLTTNQINCIGWIANCLDKNMLALAENIATLRLKIAKPLLAIIPYQKKIMDCEGLINLLI